MSGGLDSRLQRLRALWKRRADFIAAERLSYDEAAYLPRTFDPARPPMFDPGPSLDLVIDSAFLPELPYALSARLV
ncbi:MAG: hypothetical protein ACREP7_18295 [Lysobacter sp.]